MHYVHLFSFHLPPLDGVDVSNTIDTINMAVLVLMYIVPSSTSIFVIAKHPTIVLKLANFMGGFCF